MKLRKRKSGKIFLYFAPVVVGGAQTKSLDIAKVFVLLIFQFQKDNLKINLFETTDERKKIKKLDVKRKSAFFFSSFFFGPQVIFPEMKRAQKATKKKPKQRRWASKERRRIIIRRACSIALALGSDFNPR